MSGGNSIGATHQSSKDLESIYIKANGSLRTTLSSMYVIFQVGNRLMIMLCRPNLIFPSTKLQSIIRQVISEVPWPYITKKAL